MNTALADKITVASIEAALHSKSYPALKIGSGFLNLIGVRSGEGYTNTFNDILYVVYRGADDTWLQEKFVVTTDPGKFYLQNPASSKGTGILVPGYYKQSHKVGMHKNEYKALVQVGPLKVYRDSDRDLTYDMLPVSIETGLFGINIHRASPSHASTVIDNWSAACIVFSDPVNFNYFINKLVPAHVAVYGDVFDFCLLEEKDLV